MSGRAKTILVGYDGSPWAERALERAADLVGYGTSLTVVTVIPDGRSHGARPLDDVLTRLKARHLSARTVYRVGDPAGELLQAARELGADLLVVGEGKAGSVRARLVSEAPCDVLVVR